MARSVKENLLQRIYGLGCFMDTDSELDFKVDTVAVVSFFIKLHRFCSVEYCISSNNSVSENGLYLA